MTARTFAYIIHKAGVVDDSATELFTAAKQIDPASLPVAIVVGFGPDLDSVCTTAKRTFAEVWKLENESLAYPNAELVRQALTRVIPKGSIVLLAHEHFGIDLAPGLSIKLNGAFVSDVQAIEQVQPNLLKVVRQ